MDIHQSPEQVKVIFESDIPKMLKILSKGSWLENFPTQFIELLNGNKQRSIESIKYAPNIYFFLNPKLKRDKQVIRATIKSFKYNNRLKEIDVNTIPLTKKVR